MNDAKAHFVQLIRRYHQSLDLVSDRALAGIEQKIKDAEGFTREISSVAGPQEQILDVGSGVGLPGIILAIDLPEADLILVERRLRRAAFLRIVASQLGLNNVQVLEADVQALSLDPIAIITAQAVGRFRDLYCLTNHMHREEIFLFARKGEDFQEELLEMRSIGGLEPGLVASAPLSSHGRLIGIRVAGGKKCPSSA